MTQDSIAFERAEDMTKREYFAAMALQGILANVEALRARPPLCHAERAEAAVMAADALLAQLEATE